MKFASVQDIAFAFDKLNVLLLCFYSVAAENARDFRLCGRLLLVECLEPLLHVFWQMFIS
jgi:hypothetical protein